MKRVHELTVLHGCLHSIDECKRIPLATGNQALGQGLVPSHAKIRRRLAGQARVTFENIAAVLAEGDAKPDHMIRMTWYITSKREYLASIKDIGSAYRDVFGKNFPAMAVVEVSALMENDAKIEIEVLAVVPEEK